MPERVYANPINTEHVKFSFSTEFEGILRGKNLRPEVEELYSVGTERPGDDDSSYLLAVVSHWTEPFEYVDAAEDRQTETLVCSCPGFHYQCVDRDVGAKTDDCKHCERVKELHRTEMPDEQTTLIP
jgi:hypothetical protein